MPLVTYRLDPDDPPRLSPEQEARLDAMTPEEIEQNAIDDPDNPPSTEEELLRGHTGRRIRWLREKLDVPLDKVAERYRIDPVQLAGLEAGEIDPDPAFLAYLTVIELEPEAVERALAAEARQLALAS